MESEPMTHYETATRLVEYAGKRLRQHLEADPLQIDNLDEFELALLRRTQPRGFLDRVMNLAAQAEALDRKVEQVNRPDDQIIRKQFTMQEYVAVPPAPEPDHEPHYDVPHRRRPEDAKPRHFGGKPQ
jgi:hypothetical protein